MSPWGDDYPGQDTDADAQGSEDAGVEERDVEDGDHGRPVDASQAGVVAVAADRPPPLYYGSVDEFVRLYLRLVYRRRIDGTHRRWAARWWEHEEAIIRLEALWRAWEHLRLDPATGMSVWWRDHADHHMRVLMDPDGPFADIDVDETGHNTSRRGDPLPYEAPPPGLFRDERR
ncbi:DUF4913 domain-containing protein [Aquipuribacter hungaricus]|uniref:DUF4913 domain-containing protein n=1 Tax=Aquipuribacter hungaricus TaxID=545624 RepID=A0ABV7WKN9_9MICO